MSCNAMRYFELAPCEKIWLLAGELLHDQGVRTVTSNELAEVLGQALACVAVHETIDPLNRGTLKHILDRAGTVAMDLHEDFIEKCGGV